MDSLTQITLGAAVGEVVLGKKAGNRAMIWGAIAGTIPDLDVFADPFLTPLEALGFHRGISHSIFFSIFFGFLMAFLVKKFYQSNIYKKEPYRYLIFTLVALFFGFAAFILNVFIPEAFGSSKSPFLIVLSAVAIGYLLFKFWKNYVRSEQKNLDISYKEYFLLFFSCLVTHPILDSFTSYGTQLFQPFSDYRVGFNNISVADPLYTVPFLGFLIAASFYKRGSKMRRRLNLLGIIISSMYMIWTISNKLQVDRIFKESLEDQGIEYTRFMTSPTILNNVLWHCIAEGDSVYYDGLYSLLDSKPVVKISEISKNWDLLDATPSDDHTLNRLAWFSNHYYAVMDKGNETYQINDLRYGTFKGDGSKPEDYIFSFEIKKSETGSYEMSEMQAGPPDDREDDWFKEYWKRIKGI